MRIIICLLIVMTVLDTTAQTFQWAKRMGASQVWSEGVAIATDAQENVYSAGHFASTVDFDPGAGIYNLTAIGYKEIYFTKSDNAGNFIWAKNIRCTIDEKINSMSLDSNYYIYIGGTFSGTADFDPGPGVFNLNAPSNSGFVAKYDSAGNFIWAKVLVGVSGSGHADINALHADTQGMLYLTGHFSSTVDFDPGPATFNLTEQGNSNDVFILKLDQAGNFVWAKKIGGSNGEVGSVIRSDGNGSIYIGGSFYYTVDFDPGPNVSTLVSTSATDVFLLKLDASGNFVWAKNIVPGGDEEYVTSMALDNSGNVYTTGIFHLSADFDPGAGVMNIVSNGAEDVFISKINSTGNLVWAQSIGGSFAETPGGIVLDQNNNVYVNGSYWDAIDFEPGPNTYLLTATPDCFSFLYKADNAGNFTWAKSVAGSGGYYKTTLALGGNGSIYATGKFSVPSDFDPGPGTYMLTPAGNSDICMYKLNDCGIPYTIMNYSACGSITLNGNTYYSSGSYTQLFNNVNGCDSNIVYNITINQASASGYNQTACGSITYNGQTYTNSGTYFDTLLNAAGCDSIITLNLTILNVDTSVLQNGALLHANASNAGWQWISCNPFQVLPGQNSQDLNVTLNGTYAVIVTQNGCTDTSSCYTVSGLAPCGSDIILSTTPYTIALTESATYIKTSGTVEINSGSFVKLDAAPSSYVLLQPGLFAKAGSVFIAQAYNGCSIGAPQKPNGIAEHDVTQYSDRMFIYPNPTSGRLTIEHPASVSEASVFNLTGEKVKRVLLSGTRTELDMSELPVGVYLLYAKDFQSIKIIKE